MSLHDALSVALEDAPDFENLYELSDLELRVSQEAYECQYMARELDSMQVAERHIREIIYSTSQENFTHHQVQAIHQQMAHLGLEDVSYVSLEGAGDAWDRAVKLLKAIIAGIVKAAKAFYEKVTSFLKRIGEFLFGMRGEAKAIDKRLAASSGTSFPALSVVAGSGSPSTEALALPVEHAPPSAARRTRPAIFRVPPEDFSYLFINGKFAGHDLNPVRNMNKLITIDYLSKVRDVLTHLAQEIKVNPDGTVENFEDLLHDAHELLMYLPQGLPIHRIDEGKNLYASTFVLHGNVSFVVQLPQPVYSEHWWTQPLTAHLKPPAVADRSKALPKEHQLPVVTAQELRKLLDSTARTLTGMEASLIHAKKVMSDAEAISGKLYASVNNLKHNSGATSQSTHQIQVTAQMVQALRTKLLVPILDIKHITRVLHLMIRLIAIREKTNRPWA